MNIQCFFSISKHITLIGKPFITICYGSLELSKLKSYAVDDIVRPPGYETTEKHAARDIAVIIVSI